MSTQRNVSLYYREGGSDKVYHIQLIPSGDGFVVNFQYGRRGTALTTGTKTSKPVSFEEATKVYEKLLKEKTGKGYTPGESKNDFTSQKTEAKPSGFRPPMLLNPIEEEEVEKYINDASWLAQEKKDGQRRMVAANGYDVIGLNKKAIQVELPDKVIDSFVGLNVLVDGEIVGDTLYLFDIMIKDGVDLRTTSCRERIAILKAIQFGSKVIVVETAYTPKEKAKLFDRLKAENAEGIVFKNKHSDYVSGRPASYGNQLKYKFHKTATFIVGPNETGKSSVELFLVDGNGTNGRKVYMGKVTVPGSQAKPKEGQFVEVRYLYAYRDGCIFQPVYLGMRFDCDESDATISQIVYKQETEEVDA